MARIACFPALLIASCAGLASAGPVFTNGPADNLGSGREMSAWIQADDFMVSADTSITAASLDWFTISELSSWDHTIQWYVFSDNSGAPGAPIASGSAFNVLTEVQGSGEFDRYTTSFDLSSPVQAWAGNRYWFGLHFASDFASRDDLYWADSAAQQLGATHESHHGTMNNWADVSGADRAFSLIPAPGSVPLACMGAWAIIRRRHR